MREIDCSPRDSRVFIDTYNQRKAVVIAEGDKGKMIQYTDDHSVVQVFQEVWPRRFRLDRLM